MSRLLIVSADDLGLTDGVCRAIARGHADGRGDVDVAAGGGPRLRSAVRVLRDAPGLDVGAHLAMVGEDPPLLTRREIPTLVDKRGGFPLSYRTVLARGFARRIDPDDVRREFTAQLQRIRAAGVHGLAPGHPSARPPVAAGRQGGDRAGAARADPRGPHPGRAIGCCRSGSG